MSTNASDESQRIKALITRIDGDQLFSEEERVDTLSVLEMYECWGPYFRLIRKRLNDTRLRKSTDYIKLAKVQNQNLEDVFAAAETASNMVTDLKIDFWEFIETILPQVIDFEDYASEAAILSAVCERFAAVNDRVKCLERLCMLYEKRTHNESQLIKSYEHLLSIDSKNVKALRFFKLIHTQNAEWEEVVEKLRLLLECVTHPQEIFRYAQELAAVYLYQLDIPESAIHVMETYCSNSPLDTSTILYDAFQSLNDLNGCLRVLRRCLLDVNDDVSRSTLHFKMAAIHEQLKDYDAAVKEYEKSYQLWTSFLDPLEGIVSIYSLIGDWDNLKISLLKLQAAVKDDKLQSQLNQAIKRLDDGMAHGK